MRFIFLCLLILSSQHSFGQHNLCRTDILKSLSVIELIDRQELNKHNYAELWLHGNDERTFGIIGKEHQRIYIKLLSIQKNKNNPNEYTVSGKSMVKDHICDFTGKITIRKIEEIIGDNYGIDGQYKNSGIKLQGLITANYAFFEDQNQLHAGNFEGTLKSLFYIDRHDAVNYNDISLASDSYFNNSFVGKWKMNQSNLEKTCNWADYRVPNTDCDFDIGVGEFHVSEKYRKNGWNRGGSKNKEKNAVHSQRKINQQQQWWM